MIKTIEDRKEISIEKYIYNMILMIVSDYGINKCYKGNEVKFIVFDIYLNNKFLNVQSAEDITKMLGLEFVHYNKILCTIPNLNNERDKPSIQAKRNSIIGNRIREGIVIRPIEESTIDGNRIIFKHKRIEFSETNQYRDLGYELRIQSNINDIVEDWVNEERIRHILDKIHVIINKDNHKVSKQNLPMILNNICEDIKREGTDEIVWSLQLEKAIKKKTVYLLDKMDIIKMKKRIYKN
jgi:hypothetical protein